MLRHDSDEGKAWYSIAMDRLWFFDDIYRNVIIGYTTLHTLQHIKYLSKIVEPMK